MIYGEASMNMSFLCYHRSRQGNRDCMEENPCVVIRRMAEMVFLWFIYAPVCIISSLEVLNERKKLTIIPLPQLFTHQPSSILFRRPRPCVTQLLSNARKTIGQ